MTTPLDAELIGTATFAVAAPIIYGEFREGERRFVPIISGAIVGPHLTGEVLPGGGDTQLIRTDGVTELEACYIIRTTDNALIRVVNRGFRTAADDDMARLLRGEFVPPERVYFRTIPLFETAAPGYAWLTRKVFVGFGERLPNEVRVRLFSL